MELKQGQIIAKRYRVVERLGRGGMAEVFKVWDENRAAFLALKLLHTDLAQDRVFVRRFRREAENLTRLQHPNIIRFYGIEDDDLLTFILMDFVEGSNLREELYRLNGKPMAAARIMEVMSPVCSALHYAHKMGLVHCDIKPANIMIHSNGTVLVADFGISRHAEGSTTVTMVGAGTPAYMAPEQVKGLDPVPQTDIYALGVVLYEMLTGGERPFTGEQATITGSTGEKVRWEQINLTPASPRRFNSEISERLETVVMKCLEKEPGRRYASTLDLLHALEDALGKVVVAAPAQPVSVPAAAPASEELRCPKCGEPVQPDWKGCPHCSMDLTGKKESTTKELAGDRKAWFRKWGWAVIAGGGLVVILTLMMILTKGGGRPLAAILASPTPTLTSTPTMTPTPVYTATPSIKAGTARVADKDGMVQVYVPAGEFEMGAEDMGASERPVHTVYLDAYWIDKTEVTNEQYAKCVKAGACQEPERDAINYPENYYGNVKFSNYPVVWINWAQAKTYCEWAGRRLPTEAEWEKAARGTDGRNYPWGEGIDCSLAYYDDCVVERMPTEVKNYPEGASPYGVLDMAGNVEELVADWYQEDYYSESPKENPQGPTYGEYHVVRGGSWELPYLFARSNVRFYSSVDTITPAMGFRCVLEGNSLP